MKESIEAGDNDRWMFQYTTFFQKFVLIRFVRDVSHTRRKIIPSRISKTSSPEVPTNKQTKNAGIFLFLLTVNCAYGFTHVCTCTSAYTHADLHFCGYCKVNNFIAERRNLSFQESTGFIYLSESQ